MGSLVPPILGAPIAQLHFPLVGMQRSLSGDSWSTQLTKGGSWVLELLQPVTQEAFWLINAQEESSQRKKQHQCL